MQISTWRTSLVGFLLALSASWSHALVFAVNEGVTYRVSTDEIRAKYAGIAADLSALLNQPVTIEPVSYYPDLRRGLADRRYDLALVHPAHISIEAIKNSGYQLLAVTKGFEKYTANFLVNSDSAMTSLADLRDRSLGLPDEDSITAWMVRATVRDALGDNKRVRYQYTRYQDAVPFFVDMKLTLAGATASNAVIKQWLAKGGKVVAKSRPVPIKHVIASPYLPLSQAEKVREYLLSLDTTEEGKQKLLPTKYQGFAPYSQTEMLAIGTWLGL